MAVLIVDGANVVGSVPNGWWRDRRAAAARLRDAIAPMAGEGLDVVLVVEGKARGIGSVDGVEVVDAPGEGDDTIVDLVRRRGEDGEEGEEGEEVVVVTADRELRRRVEALGAKVIGPRSLAYP